MITDNPDRSFLKILQDIGEDTDKIKKTNSTRKPRNNKKSENKCKISDTFENVRENKGHKSKNNVLEWGMLDLAIYFNSKYKEKFYIDFCNPLSLRSLCPEMSKIHDKIIDLYGCCDFLILRDYISYIFKNIVDKIMNETNGVLYIKTLSNSKFIKSFLNVYDYKKSLENEMKDNKKEDEEVDFLDEIIGKEIIQNKTSDENIYRKKINSKDILQTYLLDEDDIVLEYGIIISIAWLRFFQKISLKEAYNIVFKICCNLRNKNKLQQVVEATEYFSPYPESIKYNNFNKFVDILKIDVINVSYVNDNVSKNSFDFLKEVNE
ncbi:MAG: hypothetical protein WC942_09635 [Clostridia bacterium]|jgi:hypothetical protein